MTAGAIFWGIMLVALIVLICNLLGAGGWQYWSTLNVVVNWILFALLGWKCYGPMIKQG